MVCNQIRMGRWSELIVVCVCHSDEVMREADANDTSGELGLTFPGSLVGESVFRTAKPEMLTESASWLSLISVVPECQMPLMFIYDHVFFWQMEARTFLHKILLT